MDKFKKLVNLFRYKMISLLISLIPDDEKKFTYIYKSSYWKNEKNGSLSGSGSGIEASQNLVDELNRFIADNSICSILDIPCGDWKWMPGIDLKNINYIGGDIVSEIIDDNINRYSSSNVNFKKINLTKDELISCDLIIVRDLLVHLKNEDIFKCIENIKRHDIKYIALTHYPGNLSNKNPTWGDRWRPLNLLIDPFNFNEPNYILSDASKDGGVDEGRVMAVWKKSDFHQVRR